MAYKTMPRMMFKTQNSPDSESLHSVVISLVRGLAAIEVAAAHLRADMYPGLRTVNDPSLWFNGFAFIAGFAHQSVLVFFVISGWLVGGSLLDKLQDRFAFRNYAIDRLTRLWMVLIPTFFLTLMFALATGANDAGSVDGTPAHDFSHITFIANLFGLQTILVPPFGGNFPLWSLANETWYYVMFPLLVLFFAPRTAWQRMIGGVMLLLLIFLMPESLLGYFSIWLLGVGFSRVKIECGPAVRYCWLALTVMVWAYYRLTADLSKFDFNTLLPDILCSIMVLLFLSSLHFKPSPTAVFRYTAKASNFFANFSFSLYVLHIPLMRLLEHWLFTQWNIRQLSPHEPFDFLLYLAMLAVLLGGSYISYLLFESHTYLPRRFIKRMLQLHAPATIANSDKA